MGGGTRVEVFFEGGGEGGQGGVGGLSLCYLILLNNIYLSKLGYYGIVCYPNF